jgi:uncharacterized repeat protein (TIGR01451 family)
VTSVKLTDTVPATILNANLSGPDGATLNGTTGYWDGVNLSAGDSAVFLLNGTIAPTATGNLTNTASVVPPTEILDPNNANNSSSDTDTLTPITDISITKTDGQSAVDRNDAITYTVTVTNNGPSAVSNIGVNDPIPSAITGVTWNCAIATGTGSCGTANGAGNTLNTTVNLNNGATAIYTLKGSVSATAPSPGSITNTATVAVPAGVTDSNLSNNSSTDIDALPRPTGTVDLAILQTNNLTSVVPGSALTYTITVTNNGPGTITSLTMKDTLPADLLDPVFSTPDGTYNSASGEWANLNLTPGDSISLILDATLTLAPSSATLKNTVVVQPPIGFTDAVGANNTAIDDDPIATVSSPADVLLIKRITAINGDRAKNPNDNTPLNQFVDDTVSLHKNDDNQPNWPSGYLVGAINAGKVKPGDAIEYSVYFMNAGGRDAQGIRICDRITANQDFQTGAYGTGVDLQLQLGSSAALNLTGAKDGGDRAEFISAGGAVPSNCYLKGANDNGTLVLDVTGNSGTSIPNLTAMPGSSGPGTPNDSYGFFRFITRVKP